MSLTDSEAVSSLPSPHLSVRRACWGKTMKKKSFGRAAMLMLASIGGLAAPVPAVSQEN